ncbi:LysM peptidoglycan-binding domain-containing protein [Nocardioides sp. C4-1]|uniref:LysM peptidoglycan-binding domain-containing protein n=1 Tax=Nocardioides sp. C4-1 TaxID=3151851 RepID=UPI0032635EC1
MSTVHPTHVPVYRLTRRGRLVVFVLAFLAVIAVGVALASGSMATSEAEQTTTIVVEPGQTLWSIASSVSDGDDVRDTLEHLVDLNGLDTKVLQAGQELEVPAS